MNLLKFLNHGVCRASSLRPQPIANYSSNRPRVPSMCRTSLCPVDKKPCFDIKRLKLELGTKDHQKIVKSFLNFHYWPREPSVAGLWMSLDSPYLDILSDKFSSSGDRLLAFERMARTNENNLIGVLVANQWWPWMIDELEEWAHNTPEPDKYRMYLFAHCLRSAKLFKKYNVPYIYNVDVLGTAAEVTGQGVAKKLLQSCLNNAEELRHPLVQVISLSKYSSKVCEHCGMKLEWSMNYDEFVDIRGKRVFLPRRPHSTVHVYTKYYHPLIGGRIPCQPPWSKICERCGMTLDWLMDYDEFVNFKEKRVFYPRRPHTTVQIYTKYNNPSLGGRVPCQPAWSKVCERCGMKMEWSMNCDEFVNNKGKRVFLPRYPHTTIQVYSKYFDPLIGARVPCKPAW